MKPLEILRIKDIMRIMNCGKYMATKLRTDISEHFSIKTTQVTYLHFEEYLNLKK